MLDIIKNNHGMFGDYAITILDLNEGSNSVLFKRNVEKVVQLNIGLICNHFVFIKSMPPIMRKETGFWCPACERLIQSKMSHVCTRGVCSQCKCVAQCHAQPVKCAVCRRVFKSRQCFENHQTGPSPIYKNVCKEVIACEFCSVDLAAKNGVLKVDKEGYHRDAYKIGKAAKHVCFSRKCFTWGEKYNRLQTESQMRSAKIDNRCQIERG